MTLKIIDPTSQACWGTFINCESKFLDFCKYLSKNCVRVSGFLVWEVETSRIMRMMDFIERIESMDEESFRQSVYYVKPDEKEGKARRRRRMRK